LVVPGSRIADDRHMTATMLTTTTATPAGPASRVLRWVRSRLAPTGEDLAERANWKVKTRWILGAWALLSAVSALGTALTPALLAFPMVLVAFTPRLPFLVLAATTANPVLFFCVAVPRMLVADPIHITLGRRYGGRFVPRRAQRLMDRLGLLGVALRPTSKVLAAAGACKLRTSRVLIADVLGTVGLTISVYVGATSVIG
jgi:hypothetical protein